MAHKVNVFEKDQQPDEEGWIRPICVIETDDADEALALARAELDRQDDFRAATIAVDWRLCPDLEAYFELSNVAAEWLERHPKDGCWMGKMTDDLDHWAAAGVTTPEEMAKYEMIDGYSDFHKEIYGFRPRESWMTMQTPIEEMEAAYDRLMSSTPACEPDLFEI